MSRKYSRTTLRASWSTEDLDEAMRRVQNKDMGVNEASGIFNIPSRTLRRHLITGKSKGPLGRKPVFSAEYEKKLVTQIKKLEKVGFAPERKDVKEMAFQLAKKCNIKNPFSENSESAGNVWFSGFMARNPELSQRKSKGLSLFRAYGVNRKDVKEFFDLLAKIYEENDLANHPEDIYNMDESGIQVNNKPSKVVATKGAKDVYTLTSSEKGENVTVIACVNAQGNFLPPVLIYKGTYLKP
jgi:transposase-like protein